MLCLELIKQGDDIMINIKKYETDIERLYTYFEIDTQNHNNYFVALKNIFIQNHGYTIDKEIDGVWEKYCMLVKEEFSFELSYHDDYGNCMGNPVKQDSDYYDKLEALANEVAKNINTKYYNL